MGVTRIDQLADHERAQFNDWANRWIEIGLRTGPADRPKFERAVQECYRFAGVPWPGKVVWVPSPMVLALAAPTAALIIEATRASLAAKAPRGKVKISSAQWKAAVRSAVGSAVDSAVGSAVGSAVDSAVGSAVDSAVGSAVRSAVGSAWRATYYMPGQFGVGWGWYYGTAYTSFFREVCGLDLPGDLWERGRAWEATTESACWWWPCRHFVMVCERPTVIHREEFTRGQFRLHCEDGPAVAWPDGWGVHAWHGTRVPAAVIEAPETLTVQQIRDEPNQEIRRVMLARFGEDRFIQDGGARELHRDDYGVLYDLGEETLGVRVINSTPEPDGSRKPYWLYPHPELRPMAEGAGGAVELGAPQDRTARNAVASTFGLRGEEYAPVFES